MPRYPPPSRERSLRGSESRHSQLKIRKFVGDVLEVCKLETSLVEDLTGLGSEWGEDICSPELEFLKCDGYISPAIRACKYKKETLLSNCSAYI
jgi:hypothetical protein